MIFKFRPGDTLGDAEKIIVKAALEYHGGNKTTAAKALGISERTLRKRIHLYRLAKYIRPAGRPKNVA